MQGNALWASNLRNANKEDDDDSDDESISIGSEESPAPSSATGTVVTARSAQHRASIIEYRPVPVGGMAVYFNKHEGAQPRSRSLKTMDPDARGTTALNMLKFGEDPMYKPFLLMLEHGVPLASVWDRCIEAGLDPSKLLDDPEGPAIHQYLRSPAEEEEKATKIFVGRAQEEGWRAHKTDWLQMQRSSVRTGDAPLLPRYPGLLQQQRLERARQQAHVLQQAQKAADGHEPFVPLTDDINKVTADDRTIGQMRRNFPHVYSSRPLAYKSTRGTGIGAPPVGDVWGNKRHVSNHNEIEFWREVDHGSVREGVGTWGAHKGAGGFSLAVGSRVPITWKTEKEMIESWDTKIAM
mmetsp:Transcript_19475/g.40024  ORF Transcript_19475/g.40024 Transcript_19475/m.40024 type:complete len:352 (-) Transcript_19475:90-1145(-)